MSNRLSITKQTLKEVIKDEALSHAMMNEGIWDDVRDGAIKLRKLTTNKFGEALSKWIVPLKKLLSEHDNQKTIIEEGFSLIKDAMSKSGESFHMNENLKLAKELSQLSVDDAINIVQSELQSGPYQLAKQLQQDKKESVFMSGCYSILIDSNTIRGAEEINESLGVTTVIGLILGGFGGIHLLFKGLAKLSTFLHMTKSAELFEKWAKVLHHTEEHVLEKIIPDRLAYFFYRLGRASAHKFIPFVSPKRKTPFKYSQFVKKTELKKSYLLFT